MRYICIKRKRKMLTDNHGRTINYLRLAVIDKCNLRCFYCMPPEGLQWIAPKELITYDEMMRIGTLLVSMGIEKIRITGGEPFVRKDIMQLLHALSQLKGLKEISITTNGVLTAPLVPELRRIGIRSVNLSLDTLDEKRFASITHRYELPAVLAALEALLQNNIETKVNAVVMAEKNIQDIIPLTELTKNNPVSVRFIEEMPFNGKGIHANSLQWDHIRILETIRQQYPEIKKIQDAPFSTSYNYQIPGHKGSIGIIAAYTRSFCGTCNRLRITPQGELKTCLYDGGALNVKEIMRQGFDDVYLKERILHSLNHRYADGWEAERARHETMPVHESMATIGG
jgi:molybdenum cofactor biosynthesis protein A